MQHLRSAQGCPWDRAQDYDSLKGLLLEEAYEVIDAINERDFNALEEELGDLLFQVVFYAQLAGEENRFTIEQVIERAHAKLVRRHPHVFGEKRAETPEDALRSWLGAKEKETNSHAAGRPETRSLLNGIPMSLPATLEAYELGSRAAEAGFDWPQVQDLLDKIDEEIRELRQQLRNSARTDRSPIEDEIGDLMFALVNLARHARSDPESCLRRANRKFARRFRAMEQELANRGRRIRDCSLEELDALWNGLKEQEKGHTA